MAALGAATGVVFLFLSGVTAWSLSHSASRPKLTDKDTIVLADFENKTGDPVFDDTLRQGLSVELQLSPFLSLIGDQQVQQALALMGQPKDASLTPETAQQVCERTGSAAVLYCLRLAATDLTEWAGNVTVAYPGMVLWKQVKTFKSWTGPRTVTRSLPVNAQRPAPRPLFWRSRFAEN